MATPEAAGGVPDLKLVRAQIEDETGWALEQLRTAANQRPLLEQWIDSIARQARRAGASYAQIGEAMGISKQAVAKRVGDVEVGSKPNWRDIDDAADGEFPMP